MSQGTLSISRAKLRDGFEAVKAILLGDVHADDTAREQRKEDQTATICLCLRVISSV